MSVALQVLMKTEKPFPCVTISDAVNKIAI